ncbi:hypothetical protein SK128_013231 [Halocaridina rubra]|uniref:Uncharacterized protein n=1 Tax=Halocaridina rubra TaxID=373956 RepID=A0AAN8WPN3_HALRR
MTRPLRLALMVLLLLTKSKILFRFSVTSNTSLATRARKADAEAAAKKEQENIQDFLKGKSTLKTGASDRVATRITFSKSALAGRRPSRIAVPIKRNQFGKSLGLGATKSPSGRRKSRTFGNIMKGPSPMKTAVRRRSSAAISLGAIGKLASVKAPGLKTLVVKSRSKILPKLKKSAGNQNLLLDTPKAISPQNEGESSRKPLNAGKNSLDPSPRASRGSSPRGSKDISGSHIDGGKSPRGSCSPIGSNDISGRPAFGGKSPNRGRSPRGSDAIINRHIFGDKSPSKDGFFIQPPEKNREYLEDTSNDVSTEKSSLGVHSSDGANICIKSPDTKKKTLSPSKNSVSPRKLVENQKLRNVDHTSVGSHSLPEPRSVDSITTSGTSKKKISRESSILSRQSLATNTKSTTGHSTPVKKLLREGSILSSKSANHEDKTRSTIRSDLVKQPGENIKGSQKSNARFISNRQPRENNNLMSKSPTDNQTKSTPINRMTREKSNVRSIQCKENENKKMHLTVSRSPRDYTNLSNTRKSSGDGRISPKISTTPNRLSREGSNLSSSSTSTKKSNLSLNRLSREYSNLSNSSMSTKKSNPSLNRLSDENSNLSNSSMSTKKMNTSPKRLSRESSNLSNRSSGEKISTGKKTFTPNKLSREPSSLNNRSSGDGGVSGKKTSLAVKAASPGKLTREHSNVTHLSPTVSRPANRSSGVSSPTNRSISPTQKPRRSVNVASKILTAKPFVRADSKRKISPVGISSIKSPVDKGIKIRSEEKVTSNLPPRSRNIDSKLSPFPPTFSRMADRGQEKSHHPSVTSPLNDNKPARAVTEYTDSPLDFEGNIRPGFEKWSERRGRVSRNAVRGTDNEKSSDYCEGEWEEQVVLDSEGNIIEYNNFNYWKNELPDVSREIKYILGRRQVSPALIKRNLRNSQGSEYVTEGKHKSGGGAKAFTSTPLRSQGHDSRSATPFKLQQQSRGLVYFEPSSGSYTDEDFGKVVVTPTEKQEEESDVLDDVDDEINRSLARSRLRTGSLSSGSISDYSRLVSARPFASPALSRCSLQPNSPYVDDLHEFLRRNSAPADNVRELLGSITEGRDTSQRLLGVPECLESSEESIEAVNVKLIGKYYVDSDINHNSQPAEDASVFEFDTDGSDVFEGSYDMGNIQGAEGKRGGKEGKQKGKEKGKGKLGKGKSPSKGKLHGSKDTLEEAHPRLPQDASLMGSSTNIAAATVGIGSKKGPAPPVPSSIVTDSWKQARKLEYGEAPPPVGGEISAAFADSSSSSESIFTEARSGVGGTNSIREMATPVDGETTPVFTEKLDLPIDSIMAGYCSSSDTSRVSALPVRDGERHKSTSSQRENASSVKGGTVAYEEEKTGIGVGPKKTVVGSSEEVRGSRMPEGSIPPRHPSPTQVDVTTDARVVEEGSSQVLSEEVRTPSYSSSSKQKEKETNVSATAESVHLTGASEVLSPLSVDLDFSVSTNNSVFPEDNSEVENRIPTTSQSSQQRHPGLTGVTPEESVGSFIHVDLSSQSPRPKSQSLGDELEGHHDPGDEWSTEDKPRSYSADELEQEEYFDDEFDYYSGEDMPQASGAAGAGRGGNGSAFRVSRHRKVELQPAKPSTGRSPASSNNNAAKNRALSDNCISGE